VSTCGNLVGAYTIYSVDKSTGRRSNDAIQTMTASPSCTPQITSISPTQTVAGTFDLTINGNNFDTGAIDQIYWKADGHFVGQGTIKSRTSTQIVVTEYLTDSQSGTIVVRVKNSNGQESNGVDLVISAIPSQNQPPIANAGGPYSVNTNELAKLYGSGIDPDGDGIIAYSWDFNNDGVADSAQQYATRSWSSSGTYYPTLKVQDAKGAWSGPYAATVIVSTPLVYDGQIISTNFKGRYSNNENIVTSVGVKNTGNSPETYKLNQKILDKNGVIVSEGPIDSIYLSAGSNTIKTFSISPRTIGQYSFIIELRSSPSGTIYQSVNKDFKVLDNGAILAVESDAESLKNAAFEELDNMVTDTSNVNYDMIISLTWGYIKDVIKGKIVGLFSGQLNLFTGMNEQDLAKAGLTSTNVLYKWESAIAQFGERIGLKNGLKETYRGSLTLPEETNIVLRDSSFDSFVTDKTFARSENLIQIFATGKEAIKNTMESSKLQEEKNWYEDLKKAENSWWFNLAKYGAAIALFAAVVFTIVSGVGIPLVTMAIPALKTFLGVLTILPKIGIFTISMSMLLSLPFVASEVTISHDSTLDIVESNINLQNSVSANVNSITTESQTLLDKDLKFSIKLDKNAQVISEPIVGVVVSPDGRIVDMKLYKTSPTTSTSETLSSSIKLPYQPGKYKMLAMTYGDITSSSVKQSETTQVIPNVVVNMSTDKVFYGINENVNIRVNFTNLDTTNYAHLNYYVDATNKEDINISYNATGFFDLPAKSSNTITLSFVSEKNGTYKANAGLFAGLYIVSSEETGFTVENGNGVAISIDSKDVYDPSANVAIGLTVKNIGVGSYQGGMSVTTVDTLNNFKEVYNTAGSVNINALETQKFEYTILSKENAIPGVYRSYIKVDNSTYTIPFTVGANGTIFVTLQTDKMIYSELDTAFVNISVKDVAFNPTIVTLNLTLIDPYKNISYLNVNESNGIYSSTVLPINKSVNGTYVIAAKGMKDGYRVYSDQTFFIVNERTKLTSDIPRIIKINSTDKVNFFVKSETDIPIKDAFVTLRGYWFNETKITDENGLVEFSAELINNTGTIEVSIEKGGYSSFIGEIEISAWTKNSISNLNAIAGSTYLNFTWTNPPDPDYHHVMLFLNGTFLTNITAPQNYFNVTGLTPDTEYELGTHTVDSSGNVNETWVNATARTAPLSGLLSSTISLKSGWNLISFPLNLTTWKLGNEAAVGKPINVTPANCISSIYQYNTTSALFEKSDHFADWGWWPATGSESFTALEPGRGYWVMAQWDCNLTFTGTASSDLGIPLYTGWNLIGWYSMNETLLGEEVVVGNPLNITPSNSLTSIYRYNTTSALFEKSDHFSDWGWWPATGSESFVELEPGRGYWVMAQNEAGWRHMN
jgi:hypothetical protein